MTLLCFPPTVAPNKQDRINDVVGVFLASETHTLTFVLGWVQSSWESEQAEGGSPLRLRNATVLGFIDLKDYHRVMVVVHSFNPSTGGWGGGRRRQRQVYL